MLTHLLNICKNLGYRSKRWTKPTTVTLVTASLTDITRSKADLIAENAMLRQQLIVLNRQVKRPHLANGTASAWGCQLAALNFGSKRCTSSSPIHCWLA